MVNQSAIKGEPGTGYEPRVINGVDKGPFECGNCHYFTKPDLCGQKDMMKNSEQPRSDDGKVILKFGPLDCCEYIERVGKRPKLMELLRNRTYNEAKGGK